MQPINVVRWALLVLAAVWVVPYFLLAGEPAALAPAGEKVDLQMRLQAGKQYKLRVVTDQKIVQVLERQEVTTTQTITVGTVMDVLSVDPSGDAKVKITYQFVEFKQDGPMGKIEYDSRKPPETVPQAAKGFAALAGASLSATLGPRGEPKEIKGVDEIAARLIKAMDNVDDATKKLVEKTLKEQLGNESLKSTMAVASSFMPARPVAVGESWSGKETIRQLVPLHVENTSTLQQCRDGIAVIAMRSKLASDPEAKPIEIGLIQLKVSLSGDQEGTTEVELASGWPLRGTVKQKLEGKMTMEGPIGAPRGKSWPVRIETTTTVDREGF